MTRRVRVRPGKSSKKVQFNRKEYQKTMDAKMLRYHKTLQWIHGKGKDDIELVIKTKQMADYPVDAKTIEEARKNLDEKTNLRSTHVSKTDLTAMNDLIKEYKRLEEERKKNEEAGLVGPKAPEGGILGPIDNLNSASGPQTEENTETK